MEEKNTEEVEGNRIANIFKTLVYIVLLVGIILTIFGFTMSVFYGILILISTFLIALMFSAIGEIIQLLEDIKNK